MNFSELLNLGMQCSVTRNPDSLLAAVLYFFLNVEEMISLTSCMKLTALFFRSKFSKMPPDLEVGFWERNHTVGIRDL